MSWAVLAYIVADDHANDGESLDPAAEKDLGKLLAAAQQTRVPTAAQIDYEGSPGIWRQIMGAVGGNKAPVLRREANSSRTEVLREFLEWGRKACPADHYVVMLWGHGAGPSGFFSDASKDTPARAAGHPLNPRELANALSHFSEAKGEPAFDILIAKACFAATLEVAHQLSGSARYLIASQDLIPSQTFWPYPRLFQGLSKYARKGGPADKPEIRTIAEEILSEIGAFYERPENRPGKVAVPYSLLDLDKTEAVARHLAALTEEIKKQPLSTIDELVGRARPGDPALVDIVRFCDTLSDLADQKLTQGAEVLKESLEPLVVERRPETALFRGLSLFYHPGYGMPSPVRDTARYGTYARSKIGKTPWIDMAFQNTAISQLIQKG